MIELVASGHRQVTISCALVMCNIPSVFKFEYVGVQNSGGLVGVDQR
jgi:hypothetical protein